jgi:putative ABC transport system substrate-binding protein
VTLINQWLLITKRLVLCAIFSVVCFPADAQEGKKISHIGLVDAGSPATTGHRAEAFVRGLRELGYVDGRNIVVEYRWAEGRLERLPDFIKEVVHTKST